MPTKKLTKDDIVRYGALNIALAFCLFSIVFFSIQKEFDKAFMGLMSILYVFIPTIAQRLFKFRISLALYVCIIVYTICPLLGFSYNFYYLLSWWDDILHAFAGVIFAMLGAYLPKVMCKEEAPVSLCVFSAFFFSVAISGLWELVEFSMDTFFGTDMQKDTILYAIRPSYVLSELLGADAGTLIDMHKIEVIINDKALPPDCYVDLGLLDTMGDIFIETLGAAVYAIIYGAGKGKHFVFEPVPDEEEEPIAAPVLAGVVAEVATSEDSAELSTETPVEQLTIDEEVK